MSRIYRVKINESLERLIHIEDGVAANIELLPILEKEKMLGLLADELVKRGYTKEDNKLSLKKDEETFIEVDLETSQVKVRIVNDINAEVKEEKELALDDDYIDQEQNKIDEAKDKLISELDKKLQAEATKLQQEATKKLEEELIEIRKEMDEAINSVTSSALRIRASQIGEIEEISDDQQGNMTIKIRV